MISKAAISSSLLDLVSRLPLSPSYDHRCPPRLPPSPAMKNNSPDRAAAMATMAAANGHDSTALPAAAADCTTPADAHSHNSSTASVHSTCPSHDSTQNGLHPAPQEEAPPAAEQSQGPDDLRREQSGGKWFRLTDSCFLVLHQGDITRWHVDGKSDAIVNAANKQMLGGGGVDGAIHRAAGPDLYRACLKLKEIERNVRCQTGGAVITDGFRLPVSKIIHTVGPVYYGREKSAPLLESSYKRVISLANKKGLKYIAFPAISCGVYGYPYDEAADIALSTVKDNAGNLKEVHFVLFERPAWKEWFSQAKEKFVSC